MRDSKQIPDMNNPTWFAFIPTGTDYTAHLHMICGPNIVMGVAMAVGRLNIGYVVGSETCTFDTLELAKKHVEDNTPEQGLELGHMASERWKEFLETLEKIFNLDGEAK